MNLRGVIGERIRAEGPLTFAGYMELALYHPTLGYYARAARRSGRTGDFFTSVDVGPIFGRLLAVQFAEMWDLAGAVGTDPFDLVEVGAGSGRLARDVLDAVAASTAPFYEAIRLHLVERSPAARSAQRAVLGPHIGKLATIGEDLPDGLTGVIFANELLDAFPVHRVTMTGDGLREIYVGLGLNEDRLVERADCPSTPALARYLDQVGVTLQPGVDAEINLAAVEWIRQAAQRLHRGFVVLIDYGDDAARLYGPMRRGGTLAAHRQHMHEDAPGGWLDEPGEWDLTSHVDVTAVTRCAQQHGLRCLGALDQTYFLLGLGGAELAMQDAGDGMDSVKQRLALKTLLMPGGLGSTHKVLLFGKRVGTPALRGCSYRVRLT